MGLVFASCDCPESAFICPRVGTGADFQTWGEPITVTYTVSTGSPPAPDTLAPETVATTLVGGSDTFDRTAADWVAIVLVGSGALVLVTVADLENLDTLIPSGDYAVLVWVRGSSVVFWQQA